MTDILIKPRFGLNHLPKTDSADQYCYKKGNLFFIPYVGGSFPLPVLTVAQGRTFFRDNCVKNV